MSDLNFTPIEKMKTTKEIVYEEIKNAIFYGNIKKDEILTESSLAQSLNTSRTPVREAVGDLIKDGLLVSIPWKGLKVREISPSEKEQIIFLRVSIESEGLRCAMKNITPEQIQSLRDIVDQQQCALKQNNRIEFIDLDQKFHMKILNLAEQHLLEDILLNLYHLTRLIGHKALAKNGRMEEVIEEHLQIIEALLEKDQDKATKLMEYHLINTKDSIDIAEGT
ncbi:GntR family transcriptional regulator [Neobacillus mesonae]|uniref:GntR family transcriptional regulator n=1 Tax=Neobacillus mesonae TaxID=1193713 RepID=A0A3T0I4T7_9BACI|nr:GntR family transcriptional regulator [Neobacillus mesonae]AZU64396.1 GntR family transcriptional regulator [Neobacillus mesonae]MED4203515.1 GntR family transcriptional regulator [Neobacillus mesonae]